MPGRQRRKPEGNARRELTFKQTNFNGMNVDLPASEIGELVEFGYNGALLANAENVNPRGSYIEGRRGTDRYSYTYLPGSGEVYFGPLQHPTTKRWILHRGTSIWLGDARMNFWYEATALSATTVPGTYSTIKAYNDDFLVFTKGGIFYVYLTNDEYFLFNSACPSNRGWFDSESTYRDYTVTVTASAATDKLTLADNKYVDTGTRCIITTDGTLPAGLTTDIYYAIFSTQGATSTIRLALSHTNALANKYIDITDAGSGTHTLRLLNDYAYRYVNTFVRMVKTDGTSAAGLERIDPSVVVMKETGAKLTYGADTRDYFEGVSSSRISQANPRLLEFTESISVTTTAATDLFTSGEAFKFDTGMRATFTGIDDLTPGTQYFIIGDGETTFKVATTLANALAGTAIDITDAYEGAVSLNLNYGKDDADTHMGLYRTLNVMGSTEDSADPVTGEGNNQEIFTWIADIDIGDEDYSDKATDQELRAQLASRDPKMAIMRGFLPLSNGDAGEVSQGWIFSAVRGEVTISYSSVSETFKRMGGHYFPLQSHKFNQGIKGFGLREDQLVVFLVSQTKPITLTSFQGIGTAGLVQQLDHYPDGDNTIGVIDWGSITEVEGGSIIAKCSDNSVRIWDGIRWSEDLGLELVNTVLEKMMIGSVGAFINGFWFIWYRDNQDRVYNDKCLRLGLTKKAGYGWTYCTGDKWVKPPLFTGVSIIQDENEVKRMIVNDAVDKYAYWIETFDSFTGSLLTRSYADKKQDGGFCDLNNKYFYDEMDNNSMDPSLEAATTDCGTVTEWKNRLEIVSQETSDGARLLHKTEMDSGDFDVSVHNTYVEKDNGTKYKWEVKAAVFANITANIQIDDLSQGFLAYVNGNLDGTGTYDASWRFSSGASLTVRGTVALSARPAKLRIKRDGSTVTVYADDKYVTADTNSIWATISGIKASFAAAGNDYTPRIGFNAFNVVNGVMPLGCLGLDGQGSATQDSDFRIAGKMKFMELTGNEESFNAKQREAHAYFRPVPLTAFHPAFKVNWSTYVDGNTEVTETVTNVQHHGDIQNWKEVEGRRIQYELETNMSKWRMVGMDGHYWSEDKKNLKFGPDSTDEATYQVGLLSNPYFWLSRENYLFDRVGYVALTAGGATQILTGPDNDSRGAIKTDDSIGSLRTGASYSGLTDYTIMFWAKSPSIDYNVIQLPESGVGSELNVVFPDGPFTYTLGVGGQNFELPPAYDDGNWHFFTIVRSSNTVSVYQDNALAGTNTNSTTYGGGGAIIARRGTTVADIRIYSEAKSTAMLSYYYNQVLSGGGKVLPI
ncbi:MAG: LamG domain-containing protein [Planctomycetes bacterium]|nr:LamG domain-containing protein [Planctomycetota bacterium]